MMRLSPLVAGLAAAAIVFVTHPVLACNGSTDVFEENFDSDDSPFGDLDDTQYGEGKFVVMPQKGKFIRGYLPDSVADDVDICVTIKITKETEKETLGGIVFWSDASESYYFGIGHGVFRVPRLANNKWQNDTVNFKAIKYTKDGENVLRLTIQGREATGYVNDQKVFRLKRRNDISDYDVGLFAEFKGEFEFTKFKGTSVE
jgi:hypothetical protein